MSPSLISFPSDHFSIWKLEDGVFAAIATDGGAAISNAGVIDLGGRTLVFDTLMTPQAGRDLRLAALQLTGREPDLVVNSHYHNDHIWGNQAFGPQSLFLTSAETLKLMHTAGQAEIKWASDVSARRLEAARSQLAAAADEHQRREAQLWRGYFAGLVEALPGLAVRFPDVTFEQRLVLHGSDRSAELIETHNCHTGSDSILLLRDQGIAFMADLLFVDCHPYLDEADVSALRRALQDAAALGISTFVPGHGPLGAARDIESNLRYLEVCVDASQRLVDEGNTSEDRIAREPIPPMFANWGLSRFFTANLEALCTKMASRVSP